MASASDNPPARAPSDARFSATRWSLVYGAKQWPSPEAFEALSKLCDIYRAPVYAFLRRRYTPHDAEDLTQSFFAHLLQKDFLKNVGQEKGRFRTFLLRCLKNFLINEHAKTHRKPELIFTGQDAEDGDGTAGPDEIVPDEIFYQKWALTLVERVFQNLGEEFSRKDKRALFARLRDHLTGDTDSAAYATLATEFQMTEGALRKAAHHLRQRFGELLRAEVAETVPTSAEIDDELRHIMQAWFKAGSPIQNK